MEDKNIQEVVTIAEGEKPPMIDIHEGPTQPEERVQFNDALEEITQEAEEDSDEIMPDEKSGFFLRKTRKFMKMALDEAKLALEEDEVPIGAVLVLNNKVIARDHNRKEQSKDVTSHAEINVIRTAANLLDSWRLKDAEIYITCEPCPMCLGAIIQSGIKKLVYGTTEPKMGAVESKTELLKTYDNQIEVISGVYEDDCRTILEDFFVKKR